MTKFYVLPSEKGKPPRAVLNPVMGLVVTPTGVTPVIAGSDDEVQWVADDNKWVFSDGSDVPAELGDEITEHARFLGVAM